MAGPKIVVAMYEYFVQITEYGDQFFLVMGAEYEVIEETQDCWCKIKDRSGSIGFVPKNCIKEKQLTGLQKYEWYVGDISRQKAESMLKQEHKEGSFVVRKSSTKGTYALSVYTKVPHSNVEHYYIQKSSRGGYYLLDKHCSTSTIPELIKYHTKHSGGLTTKLKTSPSTRRSQDRPAEVSRSSGFRDEWEIDPADLTLLEELGSGSFGVVRRAKWMGKLDTAVKMIKEGCMSEKDFIQEAKIMTKLKHKNLVQLYGVCVKHRPMYIVTEYMKHGSLLNYLQRHEDSLSEDPELLLDMCIQVCRGMEYLEQCDYIHRDLAARNCLVGSNTVIKVADFGLARHVRDDFYISTRGSIFATRWIPPEVLRSAKYSSKSDVWAFGILMWEVFSCGKTPYGRMNDSEVMKQVQKGYILNKPEGCFREEYKIMKKCWSHSPHDRPSFRSLKKQLKGIDNLYED